MFSAFSGWVTSAADAVNKISDQGLDAVRQTGIIDVLQNTSAQSGSAATAVEGQLAVKDFMTPPATWAGSSDEWQWCVKAALNDANTCAITPTTMQSDDNLWQEIHSLIKGLSKSGAAAATAEAETPAPQVSADLVNKVKGSYAPTADLVAFIQAHKNIYTVRSYVVPLFTSDDDYWLNLGWRLSLYRLCSTADELLQVMRTLSKLPARLHDIADAETRAAAEAAEAKRAAAARRESARAKRTQHEGGIKDGEEESTENEEEENEVEEEEEEESDTEYVGKAHLTDSTAYWSEMRKRYEAEQEKFAWLRETQERVRKEMELARGNVKLLHSLLQRQEAFSALGVSVCDSCKYHKVKLSRLIGDICASADEMTKGTVLDSSTGSLFHELFQCNEDVKNVLHAYAERNSEAGGSPQAPVAAAPANTSAPTSPLRAVSTATAPEATASPSVQPAEAHASATPKAQSVASSSAVELSAAGSVSHVPSAAAAPKKNSDDDDDDDEGSFEAKLPWSMDD